MNLLLSIILKGIGLEKRESWPESALRQVLQELMHETPSDLLSKSLSYCIFEKILK